MNVNVHLKMRGCNTRRYENDLKIDEEAGLATFFLFSLTGAFVGYQQYRPNGPKTSEGKGLPREELRYFTHITRDSEKRPNAMPVFGMSQYDWRKPDLYIVEGIFDAIALHNLGLNALAVLGNNPAAASAFFAAFGQHRIIGVLDGDKASDALAKHCHMVVKCPAGEDAASLGLRGDLETLLKEAQAFQPLAIPTKSTT